VTLVEAGPDYGPIDGGGWPDDLLHAAGIPESHDWGYAGASGEGRPMPFDRARVIGGCSSHNGCAQCAGWRGDCDAWAAAGCAGWSGADLEPLFAAVASRMRFRRYRETEIQPLQRAFLEAATAAGVPRTDDLDDLDGGAGCGCPPVNIAGSMRWNAAAAYLDPLRDNGRLQVLGDAPVDRLELRGGRCHGARVVVDGRETLIRAGETIVSAGTYGSPEILLRSGVGPAGDLAALGIAVAADRPGVGAGLRDQPASELEFAATAELRADLEAFAGGGFMPQEQAIAKLGPDAGAPYAFHLYPWVAPDPELPEGWMVALPVALLRPRSSGQVRLRSRAADPAQVEHGYLSDPDDVADLAGALRGVLDLVAGGPLARYLGRPLAVPAGDDDSSVEAFVRGRHRHYYHPTGTCRMGPSGDSSAVVDHRCRVYGLDGLRVADASVFAHPPRSTTAWPTAVVGERTAQLIAAG
jgi:choline dehydrogenase